MLVTWRMCSSKFEEIRREEDDKTEISLYHSAFQTPKKRPFLSIDFLSKMTQGTVYVGGLQTYLWIGYKKNIYESVEHESILPFTYKLYDLMHFTHMGHVLKFHSAPVYYKLRWILANFRWTPLMKSNAVFLP